MMEKTRSNQFYSWLNSFKIAKLTFKIYCKNVLRFSVKINGNVRFEYDLF